MRYRRLVLLTWLAFTATASAQTTEPSDGRLVFVPSFGARVQAARVSDDTLVPRLLSFDRNSDGRVATDELLERMRHLVARGDADRDGALDDREIRALASTSPAAPNTVRGFGIGQYAVGSETVLSSRAHIKGALDDLKLAEPARLQALAVSEEFLTAFNAEATVDLLKEMEVLLNQEQLADFKMALERQRAVTDLAVHIGRYHLDPRQNHLAHAALGRFSGERRMDDAARSALVERLTGILNEDERDDFRAALGRRPVIKVVVAPLADILKVVGTSRRLTERPVD
jgi:hypothetical protein